MPNNRHITCVELLYGYQGRGNGTLAGVELTSGSDSNRICGLVIKSQGS